MKTFNVGDRIVYTGYTTEFLKGRHGKVIQTFRGGQHTWVVFDGDEGHMVVDAINASYEDENL